MIQIDVDKVRFAYLCIGRLPSSSATLASSWVFRLGIRLGTPIFKGLLASLAMFPTEPPLQKTIVFVSWPSIP